MTPLQYEFDAVVRLIRDLGYLRVAKERAARSRLERAALDAIELAPILRQYPQVRYQPLDDHYVMLQYLAVLDEALAADLCSGAFNWRGAVACAWLVCRQPTPALAQPLAPWRESGPVENRWLFALAMAEAEGATVAVDPAIVTSLRTLRASFAELPRPRVAFPRAPDTAGWEARRDAVRAAYRAGGLAAAHPLALRPLAQWR